ncbi:hypothetical protein CWE09_10075 [Aliidiomarina minuta]|uniref:Uncharacterized protein n=1 Tax=Aliidiomarina minuta TaxID=880057 RepID=A0A432WAF7_9GAMM|nr:hypothetical protein [Aliidiomarina minuta]RUO27015.1 hypothetical protein CWE09_10075 [Aliidiomarina minuta]
MNISNYSVQPTSNVTSSSSNKRPVTEQLSNKSPDLHTDRVEISTAGYEALKDNEGQKNIDIRNASYHDIEKIADQLFDDGKISGGERTLMKVSAHLEIMSKHGKDLDKKIDFLEAWKGWASFQQPSVQDGPHQSIYAALLELT